MAIVKVRASRAYHRGVVSAIACLSCLGEGSVIDEHAWPPAEIPCGPCHGTGMVDVQAELDYMTSLPDLPTPGKRRRGRR